MDLVLEGTIAPRCQFVGAPQQLTVSALVSPRASGGLGFSCNLPDAQPVSLTISSQNGALRRDSADPGLPYAITWQVGSETPVQNFQPSQQPASFSVLSAPMGTQRSGTLTVALLQPTQAANAGTYSDQITIALSP